MTPRQSIGGRRTHRPGPNCTTQCTAGWIAKQQRARKDPIQRRNLQTYMERARKAVDHPSCLLSTGVDHQCTARFAVQLHVFLVPAYHLYWKLPALCLCVPEALRLHVLTGRVIQQQRMEELYKHLKRLTKAPPPPQRRLFAAELL